MALTVIITTVNLDADSLDQCPCTVRSSVDEHGAVRTLEVVGTSLSVLPYP